MVNFLFFFYKQIPALFFPCFCVPKNFGLRDFGLSSGAGWSVRSHGMWRHIVRWLESDISKQCSGLQWLKSMVISTLENKINSFLAKSGTRHPVTRRHGDLKSKSDQIKKFLWSLVCVISWSDVRLNFLLVRISIWQLRRFVTWSFEVQYGNVCYTNSVKLIILSLYGDINEENRMNVITSYVMTKL